MSDENVYLLPLPARSYSKAALIPPTYLSANSKSRAKRPRDDEEDGDGAVGNADVSAQDGPGSAEESSSLTSASDNSAGESDSAATSSEAPQERAATVNRDQQWASLPSALAITKPLSSEESLQYDVSGFDKTQPVPPYPFPRADADFKLDHGRQHITEAAKEMAALQPPLYKPPTLTTFRRARELGTRKETHLGIMNTLVHRFLAEGDYARASQAWALLVRAMPLGSDVRKFGRWGIGAEILLHRPADIIRESADDLDVEPDTSQTGQSSSQKRSTSSPSTSAMSSGTNVAQDDTDVDDTDSSEDVKPQVRESAPSSTSGDDSEMPDVRHIKEVSSDESPSVQRPSSTSESTSTSSSSDEAIKDTTTRSIRTLVDRSSQWSTRSAQVHNSTAPKWLPDTNFDNARAYYESMITKYEPRERNLTAEQRAKLPNYYPALMSVWIYQIVQRSRKALWELQQPPKSQESDEELFVSANLDREELVQSVKKQELAGAKEIAQRLDEVLERPLYDSNVELLRMRGMTGQWIMDLLRPDAGVDAAELTSAWEDDDEGAEYDEDGYLEALRRARRAFARALACERATSNDVMNED